MDNFTKKASSILLFLYLILSIFPVRAQYQNKKPKLIVGIIVDQMRQEYLYRFGRRFSQNGFNRLINQGYSFKNAHFNYAPTYTGPGHASVYTGSTPAYHGIIANDWYNRFSGEDVYCVFDKSTKPIGKNENGKKASPHRLLTTTIGDELRLGTQQRSKVIGVSIKDRGAVLPAGHMGTAYWYDYSVGTFMSSDHYMESLPKWVRNFNQQDLSGKYLKQDWRTLYPMESYTASGPDDSPYESAPKGKEKPTFPYKLKKLRKENGDYGLLPHTPYGNRFVTDMALATIDNEALGKDEYSDLLAISYSSTDIIGHAFGPNSVEIEDTYLRLDQEIERLLLHLDKTVGTDNYVLFLTADHAVAEVPQRLIDAKIPAGYFSQKELLTSLNGYLSKTHGKGDWVENISNLQVFLNRKLIREKNVDLKQVQEQVSEYLLDIDGVINAYPAHEIAAMNYDHAGPKGILVRGYHQKRSGDVLIAFAPGWFSSSSHKGTTHGSVYAYDTHVPLLWYGAGIPKGQSTRYRAITDIVPTLSILLQTTFPNGCTGKPIEELLGY